MKPTLLVLAAGMGSRYGGLKQMDGLGPNNETIIDYSIYDAVQAGFGKVVYIVREYFKEQFEETVKAKYSHVKCLDGEPLQFQFVTQELNKIPARFTLNPERQKPWGTAHAVLMAKDAIHEPFAVINDAQGEIMQEDIRNAGKGGESLGGLIECAVVNMPAGVGSPMFQGLENTIAQLIFGIPAVKGLEFGAGFQVAEMVGSQNNDPFYMDENGHVKTKTNHHGGILGGISSGMPIILRVAIKPTASIAKPQETVDFRAGTNEILQIHGRHDPCIVPRAVPCVEAAVNLALLSHMMDYPHF